MIGCSWKPSTGMASRDFSRPALGRSFQTKPVAASLQGIPEWMDFVMDCFVMQLTLA